MNRRPLTTCCRLWIGLGLMAAAIGVFGQRCAPPGDGGGEPDTIEVRMEGIAFVPETVTIKQGQRIRWTNYDPVPHTATSGSPGDADAGSLFDSPLLIEGESFTFTFNEAGTYIYFCRPHPVTMADAEIIVEP